MNTASLRTSASRMLAFLAVGLAPVGLLLPGSVAAQGTTPVLPSWHSMQVLDMSRQVCLDRAEQALQHTSMADVTTQDGWYAMGTDAFLRAGIGCVETPGGVLVDISVAGHAGHGADALRIRDLLRDYVVNGPTTPPPGDDRSPSAATWDTQAIPFRGHDGQRYTFECPAQGSLSTRLWGTGVYTDDSSVCTAAVHAGVITAASGGRMTIEIRPGASSYDGSTRHGVTSQQYGTWGGSFVVVGAPGGLPDHTGGPDIIPPTTVTAADWETQANDHRGENGRRYTFDCPAGGSLSTRLWGTDLYTDDSSICTAAVHAGVIGTEAGGRVTIEIRPGASSYTGVIRNGVISRDYGSWTGSFVVVAASDENPDGARNESGAAIEATWATQADSYRGQDGRRLTFDCPAGGSLSSRLWGTDLYTDDSSICTAAVHAGLIDTRRGGRVTVEIRAGAASYTGTTRNGVTSQNYGAWTGSFVILTASKR